MKQLQRYCKQMGVHVQYGIPMRLISTKAMRLHARLAKSDPEVFSIIKDEEFRQRSCISLIASENFAPRSVLEALGTVMTNKYSEGYPGARYYGGNENIDRIERLCQQRALEVFRLEAEEWGVNVQALSGSPANFCVYTALLQPHDRILNLDLPHGGHLSHGFQTPEKKVSAVSKFFDTVPYRLDSKTGLIDYIELAFLASRLRPKLIVAGTSAYARLLDYEKFRSIADSCEAILLADIAHISGLVAANVIPSPFEFADVVTTTTHKSLRGPRGSMIFFRKGIRNQPDSRGDVNRYYDFEEKINSTVFPGLQGGPHNHTITALTVALKMAASPDFVSYQKQVLRNAKALGDNLMEKGFSLVSGGTENHLILVDLREKKLSGAKAEKICEMANIILNKNTIPTDKAAMNPNGIRIGSPAMTSRGLMEIDFIQIGHFISRAVDIGIEIQKQTGPRLATFIRFLETVPPSSLLALKQEVSDFASSFPFVDSGDDQEI